MSLALNTKNKKGSHTLGMQKSDISVNFFNYTTI